MSKQIFTFFIALLCCKMVYADKGEGIPMIGIIFDCDGTLIDSEEAHYLSWKKALEKHGGTLTKEEYFSLAGHTGAYISQNIAKKINSPNPESIRKDKNEFFQDLQRKGLPSIIRTVNFVRALGSRKEKLGIKLAVASAAHKEEILFNLEHLGILELFDAVISGTDDLSHYQDPEGVNKPKPYIYLEAAKKIGVHPSCCVAFEDSHNGSLASIRAGMITFAVPNEYTLVHDFSHVHEVVLPSSEITLEDFFEKISKMMKFTEQ